MRITGQTLALINAKQQQWGVIANPGRSHNRAKREGYCSCPRAPCDRMLCSVARSGGRRLDPPLGGQVANVAVCGCVSLRAIVLPKQALTLRAPSIEPQAAQVP